MDPIAFAAGDPNVFRYARNHPTALTDPFGLEAPPLPTGGYSPKQPSWTPDQEALLEAAQSPKEVKAVFKLYQILGKHPTIEPFPWNGANRCIKWVERAFKELEHAVKNDPDFKDAQVTVKSHIWFYEGWIPTFNVHAFIELRFGGSGVAIYLDNYLYGGSDHIFFEIPSELVPPSASPTPMPNHYYHQFTFMQG